MLTNAETEKRFGRIWIVVGALCVLAILFGLFADAPFASWIATHTSNSTRHAAAIASRIGDWPSHVAAGLLGALIAWLTRRRDWLRIFVAMLLACALVGVSARVIKIATGRARPSINTESSWNGPRFSSNYNAFPSGHTASSAAFFVALALTRKRAGLPLLAIPIAIAAARLLARAHYLSDVTFAAAVGTACALVVVRWLVVSSKTPAKLRP